MFEEPDHPLNALFVGQIDSKGDGDAEALERLRRAAYVWPDSYDVQKNIAAIALRLGHKREAADALWRTVSMRPSDVDTCRLLVCAVESAGDRQEASAAWLALGAGLFSSAQYQEARLAYEQALACRPGCLPALNGLGLSCLALADAPAAIRHFRAALAIAPDSERIHGHLGYAYHLARNADEGWDELAWRCRSTRRHDYEQPLWEGSPLKGRRILLWTEQGRGDSIQFARYAMFARDQGGRVTIECHHTGLIPLMRSIPGVERVVALNAPMPPFDVHAPLVYFPSLYRASRSMDSSQIPYMFADERLKTAWRQKLGRKDELCVGISWAGNQAHPGAGTRFAPLEAFEPLARLEGVRLISLQHGRRGEDVERLGFCTRVERLFRDIFPIPDAAALIDNLDLVISVDTMIAHLAGALGKPTWTVLRHCADWRWGLTDETPAWYPTMRLFRQARAGDWAGVFERVRDALTEMKVRMPSKN